MEEVYIAFAILKQVQATSPGIIRLPVSVAIGAGKAVNIYNETARLADASLNIPAVGVCCADATTGEKATIMLLSGYVAGLSGLTANASVYLGNAGALLFVRPGAGMIQGLGYTLSATELLVNVAQP
jgi:hypothetical protein